MGPNREKGKGPKVRFELGNLGTLMGDQ